MEFTHKINNHTFKIICYDQEIMKNIEKERNSFEEDTFVRTCDYEKTETLSKSEFIANINDIEEEFKNLLKDENLIQLMKDAFKKTDGTFYKNRIAKEIFSKNAKIKKYVPTDTKQENKQEKYYTRYKKIGNVYVDRQIWKFNKLKVQAKDSNTLMITYNQVSFSPITDVCI